MKLSRCFFRLPLRFDVERLQEEVRALPDAAWSRHPTGYAGNSAVRLISVNGGENDDMTGGPMQLTAHLQASPYIQQVLSVFNTVWSRSRLMKLAPGAVVPEHADINYHWVHRVRVHIPVFTRPEVSFHCGDEQLHMREGEAWIFDSWRRHRVENRSEIERVHLVADTTGSASFWNLVESGEQAARFVGYRPGQSVRLFTEQNTIVRVMPPSEVEQLLLDLLPELDPEAGLVDAVQAVSTFSALLQAFCRDWRQLWSVYGDDAAGGAQYTHMLEVLREQGARLGQGLRVRSNGTPIMRVVNARLLYALNLELRAEPGVATPAKPAVQGPVAQPRRPRIDRPLFIVAAPRSGSTLLFETLACTPQFWTLGGEAHWLVESLPPLRPGAPGVDSNRLVAQQASVDIQQTILSGVQDKLQNLMQKPWQPGDPLALRFLEKTPKNALRIAFFNRIFPDARFLFLWRDPRENISSIIEAWKSGRWVTYPRLQGWDGPWSLLLPPGWQQLRGRPLGEIASLQWRATNEIVLEDFQAIEPERRMVLSYQQLIEQPGESIQRICRFADIVFDEALRERVSHELPLSRYTLTAPDREKWRRNAEEIEPCLEGLQACWRRLQALS
ncbi:Aspartyl/Asparaginyl beta-hydroxylase [Solimonas aquatica]|uniref:Aspartyl/Asparaginyl beta-hydroxylase n=1 Tax=Solimonas aquatica TaxID=489703 RepID=A0A1H9L7G4_9GAMM|nr:sulfotransferase [Solimonas aquatica]SER07300.1 Aspartyl/Asparaginyl beta-hydroxylase [Solimonas aquatica]